jgi:MYXO-CTERM domain-containing protein
VTSVPTRGTDTVYVTIGDSIAYAAALALVTLAVLALRPRRRHPE